MSSIFSKPNIDDVQDRQGQGHGQREKGASGKEATYLSMPTMVAFFLVVLSTLSSPIIKGMSLADIKPKGAAGGGVVQFGSWGWCVSGIKGLEYVGFLPSWSTLSDRVFHRWERQLRTTMDTRSG